MPHAPAPPRPTRRVVLGWLLAPLAGSAPGQGEALAADNASAAPAVTLGAELLRTGLYRIDGGGAHSLLRFSAAGNVLVGGKDADAYRPLRRQVARINRLGDLPLRVLILPDHLATHAANHALFRASGVALMAHANTVRRLAVQPTAPSSAAAPAPTGSAASMPQRAQGAVIGFEQLHEFRLAGAEVRLFHFGAAHSDGAAVVQFPDQKVLALGHLAGPAAPWPDYGAGGRLGGWAGALDEVLKLDFEVAVPHAGPMLDRAGVQAYRRRVESVFSHAAEQIRAGTPKDRLLSELRARDPGLPPAVAATDLDRLYAEFLRSGS